eukprot:c13660_g1_i2.p1 GENE.c13660_g1_i2~~c13660_g1_i2.p1  ORF type:complete len:102 (+),score=43.51 c13660_g1_i2:46-351(+)
MILKEIKLNANDRIMNDSGEIIKNAVEILSDKKNYKKEIQEKFSSQLIEIIVEAANELLPNELDNNKDKDKILSSKFEMEAILGDTFTFFEGIPELIGEPI